MKRLCCLSVVALVFGWVAMPVLAQGQVGLSIWNADYSLDGREIGDGPFGTLWYALEDAAGTLRLEYGYGSANGSGLDVSRHDGRLAFITPRGPVHFGAGARYIRQETGAATHRYYGPEVMAGLRYPLEGTGLAPCLDGSLGMYLYDTDVPGAADQDGTVLGYALKVGVAYTLDLLEIQGGYQLQVLEDDGDALGKDELAGFFVEFAFSW